MELPTCQPEKTARSASVPHIQFEVPRPPFPHFPLQTRVMLCGWKRSGKFALYFSLMILVAIFVPYAVYLGNGHVRPILQTLSRTDKDQQAQGIFSFALYVMSIAGWMTVIVRYVSVSSANDAKSWKPDVLNRVGLGAGCISLLGMVLIASYPRGYLPTDDDDWNVASHFPHIIGAFLLFFFGAVYLCFQTALSLYFCEGDQKRIVVVRFLLFLSAAICFATSILNTSSDENHRKFNEIMPGLRIGGKIENEINEEQQEQLDFVRCICEALMVLLFALYFFTFHREGQLISVAITFRSLVVGRRISLQSLTNLTKI